LIPVECNFEKGSGTANEGEENVSDNE